MCSPLASPKCIQLLSDHHQPSQYNHPTICICSLCLMMPLTDAHWCSKCGLHIPQEKHVNFFDVLPCEHTLCITCFTRDVNSISLICPIPDCNTHPTGIIRNWFEQSQRRSGYIMKMESESTLFCQQYSLNYTDSDTRISIDLENEEQKEKLLPKVFGKLQKILNPSSVLKYGANKDHVGSISGGNVEEKLESLADEDSKTLLHRCISALATGEKMLHSNQKIGVFVACEEIRTLIQSRGSKLKHLVSRALYVLQVEQIYKFFQKMNLSYSKKTESRTQKNKTREMEFQWKRVKLNKHCYAILLFDNLGFKNRQGSRKGLGYSQFTILKIVIINASALQRIGVYSYNGKSALSRACEDWDNLRETSDMTFEKVLEPNDEDVKNFASNTFHIVESIVKNESEKKFPSHNEILRMLAHDHLATSKAQTVFLPCYAGRDSTEVESHDETPEELCDMQVNDTEDAGVSRFDSGIIYDIPMSKDLNNTETVLDLMSYVGAIEENIKNGYEEPSLKDEIPCVTGDEKRIRLGFGGDGHPISAAQRYMRKQKLDMEEEEDSDDTEEDDNETRPTLFYNSILAVFGGFHLMLEMYKKIGSLFECTHLRFVNVLFRLSTGAVNFVLNPGDPNQAEGEMIQRHLAYILSCTRCVIWLKSRGYWDDLDLDDLESSNDALDIFDYTNKEDDDEVEEEEVSVSVDDIIKLITYRASKKPLTFVLLMEMRFAEVLFLLQRAENKANAALYCTAMKYALVLVINTNAYYYVEMIMNFFVDRLCMSEAERVVLDTFILFRRTKFGKFIFSDRSVEWMMRDIRQYLGKYFKGNTTDLLKEHLMNMHDNKELKNFAKSTLTIGRKSYVKLDKAFLEPYAFCFSVNIWMGQPMTIDAKPFKDRLDKDGIEKRYEMNAADDSDSDRNSDDSDSNSESSKEEKEKHFVGPDGEILYGDILLTYSSYKERGKKYYSENFLGAVLPKKSRRGKKDMAKVDITTQNLKEEYRLGLCTDMETIWKDRKTYTAARVKEELMRIIPELEDLDLEVPVLNEKKPNKKELATALVDARKTLRQHYGETWECITKERIKERYELNCQDPFEVIKKEIKYPFYSYMPDLMELNIVKREHRLKLGEENDFDIHQNDINPSADEFHRTMNEWADFCHK